MDRAGSRKILNSNALKLIAIAAMTIDHIAWMLFPGYSKDILPIIMHIIGRITCPIMCFFIAEGYHYTHNIKKYTARLFVFAFISHFAYIFASNTYVDFKSFIPFYYGDVLNQTGVIWSLAWGLMMLRVYYSERFSTVLKTVFIVLICLAAFPADWSCIASLCVLSIGTNRGNAKKQISWCVFYVALYAIVYFFALDKRYGLIQLCVVLAIPLLSLYNGKRGSNPKLNKAIKWLFYIYYPLHLAIIGLLEHYVL